MPVTFSGVDLRGTTAFSVTEGFSPYALFASGEQEPFTAMGRMGLVIVNPPMGE